MTIEPENLYDKEYFLKFMGGERNYLLLAQWLTNNITFNTAVDFGCGNGQLINQLYSLNKRVLGVDFSEAAHELMPEEVIDFFVLGDISKPLFLGKFDLVISLETAEHLPASSSGQFVNNLVNHSTGTICFSAAIPGQGGDGHINEQPPEFWLSLFAEYKYFQDSKLTQIFRDFLKKNVCIWWYSNNVQILRRSNS